MGNVPPWQIHCLLKQGDFVNPDTPMAQLKFKDLKWKAMAGNLCSKDLAQWDISNLDGNDIKR